jgi:DNA-binding XRE family transcriptional regulator
MSGNDKFYVHYDLKTDYLEVLTQKGEVIAHDIGDGMFKLKTARGKTVGHAVMDASTRLNQLDFLEPLVRFSIQVKIARIKRGLTQQKLAKKLGIGLVPCQRLESGDNNPTLKTILKLKEVLPEISVDKIAS